MATSSATVTVSSRIRETMSFLMNSSSTDPDFKNKLKNYKASATCNATISINFVVQLHKELKNLNQKDSSIKTLYLHELLAGASVIIPKLEQPPRNPELEARIQKLKAEQENKEYERMTRNVAYQAAPYSELKSLGDDVKSMNSQLIDVFNFLITVGGAFAFGYKATEYSMPAPNVPIQLCIGMVLATVVFFADLYFLIKHDI